MFESERRMDGLTYIFLLGVHYTCTLYTAENPLEIEISSNINIVVTLATLGTILLLGYSLAVVMCLGKSDTVSFSRMISHTVNASR